MNKISFQKYKQKYINKNLYLNGLIWTDINNKENIIIDFKNQFSDKIITILDFSEEQVVEFLENRNILYGSLYKRNKTIVNKSIGIVSNYIKWKVFRSDEFKCVYCSSDDQEMTYDHYIPRVYGGKTTIENGRTSCTRCNNLKGDMMPNEWEYFILSDEFLKG